MKKYQILIASILIIIISIIIFFITINFTNSRFGLYDDHSFWESILENAHVAVIDFFIVSVILYAIYLKLENKREISDLLKIIEFNRDIKSLESKYNIYTAIQLLNKKNITNFDLHKCDLSDLELLRLNLTNSAIHATNFKGSNLKDTNCSFAKATRTFFIESRLHGFILDNSNLKRVEFFKTEAKGLRIKNCKISKTNFINSNLSYSNFRNSNIKLSIFQGTKLTNADFSNCTFSGLVSFIDCDLYGANFKGSKNLNFLDFSKSKNIKGIKFDDDFKIN